MANAVQGTALTSGEGIKTFLKILLISSYFQLHRKRKRRGKEGKGKEKEKEGKEKNGKEGKRKERKR